MTGETYFFDTNILVYANDKADAEKQVSARTLIAQAIRSGLGCISTQVLSEFWVTVIKKLKLPADLARKQIALFDALTTVSVDKGIFLDALGIQQRNQISFWDAQILAAAKAGGCRILYSEDLQDGGTYEGILVKNPFK